MSLFFPSPMSSPDHSPPPPAELMAKGKRKVPDEHAESHQPAKCASHSSTKADAQPAKATQPVQWKENTLWTDHLVAYLLENVSVWLKLFSDSTQEAQEEGQFKVCQIIFRCQSSTYPSLLLIRSVMGSQSDTTTQSSLELSLIWRRSWNILIIQPILHSISQLSVMICNTYWRLPDLLPTILDQMHRLQKHSIRSKQKAR